MKNVHINFRQNYLTILIFNSHDPGGNKWGNVTFLPFPAAETVVSRYNIGVQRTKRYPEVPNTGS